jgi:ribosomal protein S18 acetylase RimI-like enzyme
VDVAAARALFDEQLRHQPRSTPTVTVEHADRVVREISRDAPGWAAIAWSDLDETSADDVIVREVAYFADLGRSFEWKHYDGDRPADLPDRLQRNGFAAGPPEALMIAAISELDLDQAPPEGVEIVRADDEGGLAAMVEVAEAVFGHSQAELGRSLRQQQVVDPGSVAVVLAQAGGQPISGARTEFHPGTDFASLWGGGTLSQWRHRGVYRAMVAHRAREAQRRGYSYLRVDAMPTSEPILGRLGFVRAGTTTPHESPGR